MSRLNNVERELRIAIDAYRLDRNTLARSGFQLEAANADKCMATGMDILKAIKQAQREEIARVKEIREQRKLRPHRIPRDIGTHT